MGERTLTEVVIEIEDPVITCPADVTEVVSVGDLFTIPDYSVSTTATDNCNPAPSITQNPTVGTQVGAGMTVITMTATDAAGNDASCTFNLTVEELLGIIDLDFEENISLYPNPSAASVTLRNNSLEEILAITIIDINGRIIKGIDTANSTTEITFSIEEFSSGLYFVKIEAENSSSIKRISKI